MQTAMWKRPSLAGVITAALLLPFMAHADQHQYCVVCAEPDMTYLCQVSTPPGSAGSKGMELYCIIRTSKEGGHKSCTVKSGGVAGCAGPVKSYTFKAPEIPARVKETIHSMRKPVGEKKDPDQPTQRGGEPKTLIDLTGRAVNASRDGISNTGGAVQGAAKSTTSTVGKAARGVTKAAGKAGSVTKKTGSAVGSAAKNAFDCLRSLFKDCDSSQ